MVCLSTLLIKYGACVFIIDLNYYIYIEMEWLYLFMFLFFFRDGDMTTYIILKSES